MKFYKIIKPSNIENSYLKLPEKFEKRFKNKFEKHVTIDVPNGTKWRIEVEKTDNGVWLKGQEWAKFVETLGLTNGHFLMFEFDELIDVLHVVVMGIDASEIKYPSPTIDQYDRIDLVPDSDDVIETHQPIKKRVRRREDGETKFDETGAIRCVVQGRKVYTDVVNQEAEHALIRAKAFEATEPVFIVALQPSYLSRTADHGDNRKCQLLVPRSFIVAFFDLVDKSVTLETRDERTWRVLYRFCGASVHFTFGWMQFAEDNQLRAGDVCLFELNREASNALKVSIFRTSGADETSVSVPFAFNKENKETDVLQQRCLQLLTKLS